ncbi:MAG: S1 RNA-binding domain-containing protein [Mycoplasmataceae bacterium]|jgi:predicted RNA-binding protein with RPS1 domain|nr:S1 RNA-binding domain-containing protein [Mycoplasmataceae bacterium]
MEGLIVNKIYPGKVLKISKTYAIIEVNKISGIVHISEISDYHVRNIEDFLKLGQTYDFILFSTKDNKYNFSYKRINAKLLKTRSKIIETKTGFTNVLNNMMNILNK